MLRWVYPRGYYRVPSSIPGYPSTIHRHPSGYEIDRHKLKKFQRPLRAQSKNQTRPVQ